MLPMSEAPRDGTHMLALEKVRVDGTSHHVLEWREIWFSEKRDPVFGGMLVWASENGEARFGEDCFVGWTSLPSKRLF